MEQVVDIEKATDSTGVNRITNWEKEETEKRIYSRTLRVEMYQPRRREKEQEHVIL